MRWLTYLIEQYAKFNPHTNTGCDKSWKPRASKIGLFQSTHPYRVRLCSTCHSAYSLSFQSTHPYRVRLYKLFSNSSLVGFQSTHPYRVRLVDGETYYLDCKFQSTHPYRVRLQTAKLIELGFEKPKSERWVLDVANESTPSIQNAVKRQDYSIGELVELMPKHTYDSDILHIESYDSIGWGVWYGCYCNGDEVRVKYSTENKELIDALYDMIIKLKEGRVI